MQSLQSHPFPVVAHFEKVVAVSFAFPAAILKPLIPSSLDLDTYAGLGFVTVAMVWTKHLRPAGFPKFLGKDFFLAGYRIFTRFRGEDGRKLRGLKILRSETDRAGMVWIGNLLTGYRYRQIRLHIDPTLTETRVQTELCEGTQTLDLTFAEDDAVTLPSQSPFPDWRTARQFAGPMPFTFSDRADGSMVVVEGSRENWLPRPVNVKNWNVGLFDEPLFQSTPPILANAFIVKNISYRWEKGRIDRSLK